MLLHQRTDDLCLILAQHYRATTLLLVQVDLEMRNEKKVGNEFTGRTI
jgi:hypothetical protein